MSVILSPHLDDAVLSLGQFMQTEPCTVITVFAGIPADGMLTDYDRACGFASSAEAMRRRRNEDVAALDLLGANAIHYTFLDQQYGGSNLDTLLSVVPADAYIPLGIGHPDHVAVAAHVRRYVKPGVPLFFYEELPYRIDHPEQAHEALQQLRAESFAVQDLPFPLAQGSRDVKAEAIGEYRSQFPNGADNPALLCAERVWRAVKTA